MFLSIAIAVRNGERYIDAALEAVKRQTRLPDEVVICDDASDDATPEILQAFARNTPFPVRIERLETGRGYNEACLHATRLCRGDVIAFCDADDVWFEQKLEVCARELDRSGALLVMHSARAVDSELRDLSVVWPDIDGPRLAPPLSLTGLDVDAPTMAIVCRSGVLRAADWETRPPSRYGLGQMLFDEWIFFLAGVLGSVRLLPQPLLLYRRHEANLSEGPLSHKRRVTLQPAVENYRAAAHHTAACAQYLDRMRCPDETVAARIASGVLHYRRVARNWAARVALYESGERRRRARLLRRLLSENAYSERMAGGFGRTAFAKDVVAGLVLSLPADPHEQSAAT